MQIGLPKGMTRDEAYIQGIVDGQEQLLIAMEQILKSELGMAENAGFYGLSRANLDRIFLDLRSKT